jgi:hypothetical protein
LNFELSQEIPSSDLADQEEEDDWDTMGKPTERSRGPAPTVEEPVPQMAQQTTSTPEPQVLAEESWPEPSMTTGAGGPVVAQAEEEGLVEAGIVDISSILSAPTVTVVRSSL